MTPFKIASNLSGAARTDPFLIPGRDLAASTASFSLDQLGGVSPSSGCFDSPAKLTLFGCHAWTPAWCIARACRQCWNFVATARQYGFLIILPQRSLIRLPGLEAGEAPSLPIDSGAAGLSRLYRVGFASTHAGSSDTKCLCLQGVASNSQHYRAPGIVLRNVRRDALRCHRRDLVPDAGNRHSPGAAARIRVGLPGPEDRVPV